MSSAWPRVLLLEAARGAIGRAPCCLGAFGDDGQPLLGRLGRVDRRFDRGRRGPARHVLHGLLAHRTPVSVVELAAERVGAVLVTERFVARTRRVAGGRGRVGVAPRRVDRSASRHRPPRSRS